ncbi:MAG: 30S ribosomal protein S4, partial [Thermoplasmata archaeon HGW-Thermoplasmata-2]
GLSGTIEQARQFINHGHIGINSHKVSVPGMLVTRSQEQNIAYMSGSPLMDSMHPMRPKVEFGAAPRPEAKPVEAKPVLAVKPAIPATAPQAQAESSQANQPKGA